MTARFLFLGLVAVCGLHAQTPSFRALPNFLEMTVGPRLCRWWALHATAQVEAACQVNGIYSAVHIDPIAPWLYGSFPLGSDVPVLPPPMVSGAILWLIWPDIPGRYRYEIVGWPTGGAPLIERGAF